MTPTTERLQEITKIAKALGWIYPIEQPNTRHFSYPLMQLSEVEKCMIAMNDDKELERMRKWYDEVTNHEHYFLPNGRGQETCIKCLIPKGDKGKRTN